MQTEAYEVEYQRLIVALLLVSGLSHLLAQLTKAGGRRLGAGYSMPNFSPLLTKRIGRSLLALDMMQRSMERFHYAQLVKSQILWQAMLGEGERDATAEEIAAIEAAHGPFLPPDGEG